jgi:uncharacterized membrane protein
MIEGHVRGHERIMRILLFCALMACTTSTGITESEISCDTSLTYANFGEAFFQTNCLDCHDGKQSPNLATQAAIQARSSDILDEAVYTSAMPDGRSISNDERILLGQWLSCGAP